MTVEAKYRITITDLNSGEPVSADGLRGSFETKFGLVCALVSTDDGNSFAHALVGHDFTQQEFRHMLFVILKNLGRTGRQVSVDEEEHERFIAGITGAFKKWLEDELGKPGAALMLAGMSMLAAGMDPVPEEGPECGS